MWGTVVVHCDVQLECAIGMCAIGMCNWGVQLGYVQLGCAMCGAMCGAIVWRSLVVSPVMF